ncbi:hypothetical protein LFL96_31465 [Paraburkholderia sp. D15]|uniref:hypothetical protein n=1 Tax=Paraburkholderia sp. D15 TaxID=2880218 RepID=UPI00247A379F|nr:hypothetical protein [Paraburkholderia sp. D15]WGS52705.1 hypothetical protein LFL96_31465 [Paraburkholderia sp. D15]
MQRLNVDYILFSRRRQPSTRIPCAVKVLLKAAIKAPFSREEAVYLRNRSGFEYAAAERGCASIAKQKCLVLVRLLLGYRQWAIQKIFDVRPAIPSISS